MLCRSSLFLDEPVFTVDQCSRCGSVMVHPVDEKHRAAIQDWAEVQLRTQYGLTVAEPESEEDRAFKPVED